MSDPIAYTYEADHHCPKCAEERFGRGEDGFIATGVTDSEGNEPGAIAPWEEWYANDIYEGNNSATLACGTCGAVIAEVDLT